MHIYFVALNVIIPVDNTVSIVAVPLSWSKKWKVIVLAEQHKANCKITALTRVRSRGRSYVMGSSSAVGVAVRNCSSSSRPYSDFAKCRKLARSVLEIPPIATLVQNQYHHEV